MKRLNARVRRLETRFAPPRPEDPMLALLDRLSTAELEDLEDLIQRGRETTAHVLMDAARARLAAGEPALPRFLA